MAKKSKKGKVYLSIFVLFLVIVFVALCYFYPPFLDKIKSLFSKDDSDDYRVEGDTTYVTKLEDLKVHFVDVGQGDCILIELPDGKNVIIDAGQDNFSDLKNYINDNTDIEKFDYAIATHADYDHIGNFDDILGNFEVKNIYRPYVFYNGTHHQFTTDFNKGAPNYQQDTKAYGDFLKLANEETYLEGGETKKANWQFFTSNSDFAGKISYNDVIYEYYFDFLTPFVNLDELDYTDANDYSPMVKFTYCGVDILFTGDAEKDAEGDFVEYYKNRTDIDLDVDILKVGHHGSLTSTTQALLNLVKPEYSVIQCGVNNKHRHPRQNTIDRLLGVGSSIYRNDLHGDILLNINAQGVFTFTTQVKDPENLYVGGDILYA